MSLKPFIVGVIKFLAVLALLSAVLCGLIAVGAFIVCLIAAVVAMLVLVGVVTVVVLWVPLAVEVGAFVFTIVAVLLALAFLFAAIGLWILADKVDSGQIPSPTLPPFPWPPRSHALPTASPILAGSGRRIPPRTGICSPTTCARSWDSEVCIPMSQSWRHP